MLAFALDSWENGPIQAACHGKCFRATRFLAVGLTGTPQGTPPHSRAHVTGLHKRDSRPFRLRLAPAPRLRSGVSTNRNKACANGSPSKRSGRAPAPCSTRVAKRRATRSVAYLVRSLPLQDSRKLRRKPAHQRTWVPIAFWQELSKLVETWLKHVQIKREAQVFNPLRRIVLS